MIKKDEDAYLIKNLLLFTVEYDHYWDQKKKLGNQASMIISMLGEYCIFVL